MPSDAAATTYDRCPACRAAVSPWRTKTVSGIAYRIDRCGTCDYAFVNPRPSLDFILDYYRSAEASGLHGDAGGDLEAALAQERAYPNATVDARRMIDTIAALAPKREPRRLLDVGSGYGFFSKAALEAGFEVAAIELGDDERHIYREMTGIEAAATAFEDYPCTPGSQSAILMSQILEHAIDVEAWVAKANDCLAPGGILAIALPNFAGLSRLVLQERDPFICPPVHLNYFAPNSLTRLLTRSGFAVEATQWVSRVPDSALTRRLTGPKAALLPLARVALRAGLGAIDAARLGMIINVYARKGGAAG